VWLLGPEKAPQTPPSVRTPTLTETAPVAHASAQEITRQALPPRQKETAVFVVPAAPKPPAAPEAAAVPESRVEKPQPPAPDKVLALAELPLAIRNALPEFKISGHAYTPEPQTRVVRINEKILQEGQELSPGLRVEEIVQGGIIMSYGGYRFRININEPN